MFHSRRFVKWCLLTGRYWRYLYVTSSLSLLYKPLSDCVTRTFFLAVCPKRYAASYCIYAYHASYQQIFYVFRFFMLELFFLPTLLISFVARLSLKQPEIPTTVKKNKTFRPKYLSRRCHCLRNSMPETLSRLTSNSRKQFLVLQSTYDTTLCLSVQFSHGVEWGSFTCFKHVNRTRLDSVEYCQDQDTQQQFHYFCEYNRSNIKRKIWTNSSRSSYVIEIQMLS